MVVIGNVESFVDRKEVTFDSDFVQVHVHSRSGTLVYVRSIRQRNGEADAKNFARILADHVEEVVSLVSTPSLVAWLLDCGFSVIPCNVRRSQS
jgi:hypothetical protein